MVRLKDIINSINYRFNDPRIYYERIDEILRDFKIADEMFKLLRDTNMINSRMYEQIVERHVILGDAIKTMKKYGFIKNGEK